MIAGRDEAGSAEKPTTPNAESTDSGEAESATDDETGEGDEAEAEAEDDEPEQTQREAIDAALAELRSLPTLKRYRVISAAVFVAFFLGMMLLRGLHENHIKPALPYVVWYFDGLGLARTWGMFAHPSTELPVYVYGVTEDEREVRLSPEPNDSFALRIRDQRMRKVRSHMANKDQRNRWGADLSLYFCRMSKERGVPLRFVRITEINRMEQGEGKTLLQTRCKG